MAERPAFVIRTDDLGKSLAFYRDAIGYEVIDSQTEADMATIDAEGTPILLAGPAVADLTAYTAEGHRILRQGIWRNSTDLDADHARLEQMGISGIEVEEKPWGDREMRVSTPEGLTVTYGAGPKRSQEEELALLASASQHLDDALAGLSDAELDLTREQNGWSIRQIVHHMADTAVGFLWEIKSGIGASGSQYAQSWFSNEQADKEFKYASSPIDTALLLFRACSNDAARLLRQTADYRERFVLTSYGPGGKEHKRTIAEMVQGMVSHTLEHIHEINEIRRISGK
jgi:catechol 2,3-dioxygenase-like lactoylglutathione lyase family enzyme